MWVLSTQRNSNNTLTYQSAQLWYCTFNFNSKHWQLNFFKLLSFTKFQLPAMGWLLNSVDTGGTVAFCATALGCHFAITHRFFCESWWGRQKVRIHMQMLKISYDEVDKQCPSSSEHKNQKTIQVFSKSIWWILDIWWGWWWKQSQWFSFFHTVTCQAAASVSCLFVSKVNVRFP